MRSHPRHATALPFRSRAVAWLEIALSCMAIVALRSWAEAGPWPVAFDAPPARWQEGSTVGHCAYRGHSCLFLSEEPLERGRIAEMVTVAESVRAVLRRFPLPLLPERPAGRVGVEPVLDVVRIYATHQRYLAAGGPTGSVGFYNNRSGEVMVSLDSLIEPKSRGSNLEPRQRYRLLVHELVHQAMGERTAILPLWFSEGIAEYLAAAQIAPGRYRFDIGHRQIISHLRAVWLHDRRQAIVIPPIAELTRLTSNRWIADNIRNRDTAYAKYAGSLLLTHYQLELAARNAGGLRAFLEEARRQAEARKPRNGRYSRPALRQDLLWNGESPAAIEKRLVRYWQQRGLHITFALPPDS